MKHTPAFTLKPVRSFAQQHDDLPAFHAAYLVLTFLAAAMFNLGFFAMLIVIHMVLDVFKYRDVHGLTWRQTIEGVVRESLVDCTLLLMGLTVSIYLHPSITGLAGIKGMMLAELTIVRGLGIMTPKLRIVYEMIKILANIDHYLSRLHPRLHQQISAMEWVCLLSIIVTVAMLIVAPIVLAFQNGQYVALLIAELTPWRL